MSNDLVWKLVAAAAALIVALWMIWSFAAALGGATEEWSLAGVLTARWNVASLVIGFVLTGLLSVAAVLAGRALRAKSLTEAALSKRYDSRAKDMSSAADIAQITTKRSLEEAYRLGAKTGVGVTLGKSVVGDQWLWASWEWTQVWIMGTRAGKTRSLVVPQILETTGPVLATSNKPDLVTLTRPERERRGTVWVQDPQGLAQEQPTWWWNPLSYVTTVARADEFAGIIAAASRDEGASTDAYFDPAAQRLLSDLLLAAAVSGHPMTMLTQWLSDPDLLYPETINPVGLLREAGQGPAAQSLRATLALNPEQRDGVVGMAQQMTSFLRGEEIVPWITDLGDGRPEFQPEHFVRQRSDTLLLLSKEGPGSARAITATLTVAVVMAAQEYATSQPGARLARPLLVELDEAANVVRWPELPNLMSYVGSRGILISIFLQSYAQGVSVWGKEGMQMIWSAANVRGLGRSTADADHLRDMETLIGTRKVLEKSRSVGRGWGSTTVSTQVQREPILNVAELAALPPYRAVLFVAGSRAILMKLETADTARPGFSAETTNPWILE